MSEMQPAEDSRKLSDPPSPGQDALELEPTLMATSQPSGDAPTQPPEINTEPLDLDLKEESTPLSPSNHMEGDKAAPGTLIKPDLPSDGTSLEPQPVSDHLVEQVTAEAVSDAPAASPEQPAPVEGPPATAASPTDREPAACSSSTPAGPVPASSPSPVTVSGSDHPAPAAPPSPAAAPPPAAVPFPAAATVPDDTTPAAAPSPATMPSPGTASSPAAVGAEQDNPAADTIPSPAASLSLAAKPDVSVSAAAPPPPVVAAAPDDPASAVAAAPAPTTAPSPQVVAAAPDDPAPVAAAEPATSPLPAAAPPPPKVAAEPDDPAPAAAAAPAPTAAAEPNVAPLVAAPPVTPTDSGQDDSGCDTEPEPEHHSSAPASMAERSGPEMADVEQLARSVVTDTLSKAKQEANMQRQLDHQKTDPDTDEDGWLDIVGNGQLKKKVLTAGSGDRSSRPQRSQLATVHLSARLEDGRPAAGVPERLTFGLGDGEVVTGLDMAVGLMQPGETADVYMDARFAYGERGLDDVIPPNANLTFTVQLENVQPEPKYEGMSAEERLEVGSQKRDRGNWWFKRDDFNHAIQCYRRALDFFDNESDEFTGLPDDVHILFEERLKVHNNMAAAQMKLEAYDAALRSVQLVLTCQPHNVKALYRKGKILMAQNKVSDAAEALREALKHSPENRTVQTELNKVLGAQRKQAEEQKSLYRKMLGLPPAEDRPEPANTTKSVPVRLIVAGVACALAAVAISRLKLF